LAPKSIVDILEVRDLLPVLYALPLELTLEARGSPPEGDGAGA
jgi:hypothetical protein